MKQRTSGKAYEAVIAELQRRGLPTEGVSVMAFGRGPQQEIVLNDRIIGSYNWISKVLSLHDELELQ